MNRTNRMKTTTLELLSFILFVLFVLSKTVRHSEQRKERETRPRHAQRPVVERDEDRRRQGADLLGGEDALERPHAVDDPVEHREPRALHAQQRVALVVVARL